MENIREDSSVSHAYDKLRSCLAWLGIAWTIIVTTVLVTIVADIALDGVVPVYRVLSHESLHVPFLLIALGAYLRTTTRDHQHWRWTVGAAVFMLAAGVIGEITGLFYGGYQLVDIGGDTRGFDSLEPRLLRLGAMAIFALPMLALIAASEAKPQLPKTGKGVLSSITCFLVRWEAVLFTVGVVTLPTILIAGAFINKEFTWLSPIGADATAAACVAATIRARFRGDGLAFSGWLLICSGLTIGMLMGIYSFGGPVPTPEIIGDYNALPRTLMREVHVIILITGIVGVAVAMTRKQDRSTT